MRFPTQPFTNQPIKKIHYKHYRWAICREKEKQNDRHTRDSTEKRKRGRKEDSLNKMLLLDRSLELN